MRSRLKNILEQAETLVNERPRDHAERLKHLTSNPARLYAGSALTHSVALK
jgi:hypothetical protein